MSLISAFHPPRHLPWYHTCSCTKEKHQIRSFPDERPLPTQCHTGRAPLPLCHMIPTFFSGHNSHSSLPRTLKPQCILSLPSIPFHDSWLVLFSPRLECPCFISAQWPLPHLSRPRSLPWITKTKLTAYSPLCSCHYSIMDGKSPFLILPH